MPLWSVTDTQFPIDSKQATYINPAYNKKLSTITATNPTGFVPVDPNSTDPIIRGLQYTVRTDNKVVFGRPQTGTTGGIIQYNTAQELGNAGISGYTAATTDKLKEAMQKNLSASAKSAGVGPVTAPDPPAPTPTSNPNNGPAAGISTSGGPPGFATQNVGKRLNRYKKEPLVYPLKRQGYGGDYIQFEIRTYEISGLASPVAQGFSQASDVTLVGMEKRKSTPLAYIYLPIQSGISDSMSVEWGTGELNPITAAFANAAYNTINASAGGAWEGASAALKGIQSGAQAFSAAEGELRQMMINYFVERAVNTPGLLSRTMGAALNNNLELLFTGPTLRNFTFNFKLTPREPKEAEVIKEIIRYFKKSMVPGLSNSKLFLLAPNVFKIKYVYTGKGNKIESHPYLNKIKVAALRDFAVNYTPDGNYMTYGADGSMTQYDLSMSFGEIDPIYEPDYEEGEGLDGMGW